MTEDERAADGVIDYSDANVTLDVDEDRWGWRARLRRHRATHLAWRTVVGVLGSVVTVGGLIMVPAPGPGWAVVILGLVILASEFEFAQRWLDFVKGYVHRWNVWVMSQPVWIRWLIGFATLLLVWTVLWVMFLITGVPAWTPDWAEAQLVRLPGVD
jgi:uncharacterized protein (TIGR02611 family)